MTGLVPGIHVLKLSVARTWMAGTSPAMTKIRDRAQGLMLTETTDYETLYRDFRWDIPARFNIATACCDRHADGTGAPGADLCR